MKILHLHCSPRGADSHSLRFSQQIVARLMARSSGARVTARDLAGLPPAHVDSVYAHALAGSRMPTAEDSNAGALVLSETLIREVENADAVVIGTPMHNYTVPSSLKAWIDHVLRIHRSFVPTPEGKRGLLHDRPVFIAVASGGRYLGDGARQPDFLTPYLKAVFETIGLRSLHFFPLQSLVMGDDAVGAAWRHASALLDAQLPMPPAVVPA
ncbi:hypothetical protein RD110_05825 [Rhodoferax koreense]|uniref:FMN dependent NADH:quinone oxidoreductase n=1 Tax=Rhodoferax koreensis TaxID=1842727 RepID=A0A1P8JSQ8_9BURK|nr:NAD(P)H-dependent oxidoreductase [Rhodoferax koreense]APW36768.1 hypothetical protein RD110_05825 [Rhodoferax koreense]